MEAYIPPGEWGSRIHLLHMEHSKGMSLLCLRGEKLSHSGWDQCLADVMMITTIAYWPYWLPDWRWLWYYSSQVVTQGISAEAVHACKCTLEHVVGLTLLDMKQSDSNTPLESRNFLVETPNMFEPHIYFDPNMNSTFEPMLIANMLLQRAEISNM